MTPLTSSDSGEGFSGVLANALQQVNQLNGGAEQQIGSLLKGGNTDVSSVMIAVEKADVAFQLMMQVRNKIVNAYQDIEKMQF
jgi:flagellar hook-basal body complex protein FliE